MSQNKFDTKYPLQMAMKSTQIEKQKNHYALGLHQVGIIRVEKIIICDKNVFKDIFVLI